MEDNMRRKFLKSTAVLGSTFLMSSAFGTEKENSDKFSTGGDKTQRILGTGNAALKVSSLGLGCMGMSYHRSFVPDKKVMFHLIGKAYDMGLNFFDTAEAYGPLSNEELIGEA